MKILVAYDGSREALRAIEWATRLDGQNDVAVISVAPSLEGSPKVKEAIDPTSDVDMHRRQLKDAKDVLEQSGIRAEMLLRVGNPAEEIINAGADGGFDLIIMGIRGMGAVRRFIIGSVADRVVRHATIPVLVAR